MSVKIKSRIIALVDMDCFYVQVVQRKNPNLYGKPCAVVQYNTWRGGGIIAVSYEARKCGVTRQMRGDEAKEKCPEIVLVHVPESRGKADLTQFREAGAEVIDVLATFEDCIERASVDEAFLDLTSSITRDMNKYNMDDVALKTFQTTHIIGLDNIDVRLEKTEEIIKCELFQQWLSMLKDSVENYKLAIGAVITDNMRNAVKKQLGFSCSAGVGQNKVLAKVVAGFHKPDQQTLILPEYVQEMHKTTKLRKVRNLGGKLGAQLEEKFKVEFMSDLCELSLQELQANVGGKSGEMVYWLCRGIHHEPVRPRQLPQSIGCSKNFPGKLKLKTKEEIFKWLTCLCEEVSERLVKDKEQNNRIPSLFTVGCVNESRQSQTRRCSVLNPTPKEIAKEAFRVLSEFNKSSSTVDWTPTLINLSLSAIKFQSFGACTSKSINTYMETEQTFEKTVESVPVKNTISDVKAKFKGISTFFPQQETVPDNALQDFLLSREVTKSSKESTIKEKTVHKYFNHVSPDENKMQVWEESICLPMENRVEKLNTLFNRFRNGTKTKERVTEQTSVCSTTSSDESKTRKNSNQEVALTLCEDTDENIATVSTIDDLMICSKCGKRILVWDLQEHMDFHFAMEIKDAMKNDFINLYKKQTTDVQPSKKKAKTNMNISSYFSSKKES